MSINEHSAPGSTQQGVVLLEALIAILIFSLGILAVVGLQAAMVRNTTEAHYRSIAGYVAQERIAQMWADPEKAATYLEENTKIPDRLPFGTRSVDQPVLGQFRVIVRWQMPGSDSDHRFTTIAYISGG